MENLTLTPVALLADSLRESHGITFDNVSNNVRPDWWAGRYHGYKIEIEQQKRGQLRVIVGISGSKQQALCDTEALGDLTVDRKPWGIILPVNCVEEMVDVVDALGEGLVDAGLSKTERVEVRGASFKGTVFERSMERGATLSVKFMSMVCEAAGMNLMEMMGEQNLDNGRQVDGWELDPVTQKPITIFECQSGIHNGQYLDSNHRDKALGEYLYDTAVLPTVRKVVILAGGYSDEDLRIVHERAYELSLREQPIEVVLLQTVRMEDVIKVVTVSY